MVKKDKKKPAFAGEFPLTKTGFPCFMPIHKVWQLIS